ncbi:MULTISPECIES: flagellar hook-associated protein FlgL [Pantoea]|jgi:flagellar hook-associated protein 3 FlgL|uniref:flagellar hook-associated protein FlgL n=1 Tax=Pantoea TaxID=53335 RepID=UPI00073E534C|nr:MULTISPECIES: flagellar hook-associated protein FlgL [Pantoea]KAF0854322.1 flagellar hook-associated protein FlgL [Pantoea dispersa 625]MBS0897657.1 flagellar hook-associated protein FlgL [Pantoea dispersa]MBU6517018.1 flagellar hook-associated protein FlgL [Pantoea sp. B270]MDI6633165.1 flagellar hook-associated protein FlgL [Pantoea dispersa]MDT8850132.1 flagellar hook-associated protein FlgL [Pantoea dispersa]
MRLSTNMIFDQQVRGVTDAQSSWLKAGEQLSTGRRVTNPSDDPIAASRAVVLSQTQARDSQFALARSFANQGLSLEESTLSDVTTAIQSAQSTLISAGNGSLSDDDRASYATQLEGIRSQLLNLANSKDGNGRYLFAGYASDKPPFTEDASGKIIYSGGSDAITQKVDSERTMTVGHTGNSIFDQLTSNAKPEPDGSASQTNLFDMLDDAIAALKVPQNDADDATKQTFSAAMDKANRGFSNSLNNVLAVRSEIGTQLDELDTLDAKGDDRKVTLKDQMSTLVNVDYTEAISTYTMQQQLLQASYTTFSDMSKMSLFQMNK